MLVQKDSIRNGWHSSETVTDYVTPLGKLGSILNQNIQVNLFFFFGSCFWSRWLSSALHLGTIWICTQTKPPHVFITARFKELKQYTMVLYMAQEHCKTQYLNHRTYNLNRQDRIRVLSGGELSEQLPPFQQFSSHLDNQVKFFNILALSLSQVKPEH